MNWACRGLSGCPGRRSRSLDLGTGRRGWESAGGVRSRGRRRRRGNEVKLLTLNSVCKRSMVTKADWKSLTQIVPEGLLFATDGVLWQLHNGKITNHEKSHMYVMAAKDDEKATFTRSDDSGDYKVDVYLTGTVAPYFTINVLKKVPESPAHRPVWHRCYAALVRPPP